MLQKPTRKSASKPRLPVMLLTGFDATSHKFNASSRAISAIGDGEFHGCRIVTAELPTVFGASLLKLRKLIMKHKPQFVICTGEAGRRSAISVERIAINIDDASRADNRGAQPTDKPVIVGAPAAYFSTLPVRAIYRALEKADIPVEISQTAGTFVCNHVFYGLMHELATRKALHGTRGGFIHIPYLVGQDDKIPGMPLERIVAGLRLAIVTTVKHKAKR